MRELMYRLGLSALYVLLDVACIFLSVFLAYGVYQFFDLGKEVTYPLSLLASVTLGLAVLCCSLMYIFSAYHRESGLLNVMEIRGVILGILTSFALTNIFFFAVQLSPSRYILVLSFLFVLLLLPLARSLLYNRLSGRLPEALQRRILIYGAGKLGQRLYREIHNSPRMHRKVCGFVDDNPSLHGQDIQACGFQANHGCHVLGGRAELPELVHAHQTDDVYIAISDISSETLKELYELCRKLGVGIAFVPFLHEVFAHRVRLERVGNLPLIWEQDASSPLRFDQIKRLMDLGLCAVLGVVLFPLMGIIAWAVRRDSPGPILFRQERVGKNGRIFEIYKFRTMFTDGPKYAVNPLSSDDPRITRVGRFLRRTSLDELPQIINVLKGEMSFVGPRPEMPFIVEQYNEEHRERLKVLPGITGLWQLSGDRSKAIHENMEYDLYYVYNRSFFLDVTILLQTLVFAFRGV